MNAMTITKPLLLKATFKTSAYKTMALLVLLLLAAPVTAKEAASMAADPEMEKIVNEISAELRCLVCQNQTIADSSAGLAVDLKNQVRDMVKQGQSQDEIVEYMVTRYGDFVLYRPPVKPTTMLLWAGPFLLLLVGLTVLVINLRKRAAQLKDGDLSSEENERLKALLESESVQKEDKS
jgi:cytochrome c-type biogenesis protein CcmH